MNIVLVAFIQVLLISKVFALLDPTSFVIEFGDANIETTLEQSRYSFIYFFSDSCGFCDKFNPDFENLSLLYNNRSDHSSLQIIKTNARANKRLSGLFSINRYPSLRLLDFETKEIIEYDQDKRDLASLINFVQARVPGVSPNYDGFKPSIHYFEDVNFDKHQPNSLIVFTLPFLMEWKDYVYPTHGYQKLALDFPHIQFGLVDVDKVSAQDTLAKYHITNFPAVIYFHNDGTFKVFNTNSQNHVIKNNLGVNDIEIFLNNLHTNESGKWYKSLKEMQKDLETIIKSDTPISYGKKGFNVNHNPNPHPYQQDTDIVEEYDSLMNHIEL
ncbi:uncharacterized protein RJT21DRAFT_121055 [Scheffersomyces amazonensis]|uniref:uncharacterized protein n=1 Tax=Scheffersomyces amazonensis TaxID=1078765 RepID=UPI00315CFA60